VPPAEEETAGEEAKEKKDKDDPTTVLATVAQGETADALTESSPDTKGHTLQAAAAASAYDGEEKSRKTPRTTESETDTSAPPEDRSGEQTLPELDAANDAEADGQIVDAVAAPAPVPAGEQAAVAAQSASVTAEASIRKEAASAGSTGAAPQPISKKNEKASKAAKSKVKGEGRTAGAALPQLNQRTLTSFYKDPKERAAAQMHTAAAAREVLRRLATATGTHPAIRGLASQLEQTEPLRPIFRFASVGRANSDLRLYRRGYPGQMPDDPAAKLNIRFYKNKIKSQPRGDHIDQIHQ
jgi:hypothetical protein